MDVFISAIARLQGTLIPYLLIFVGIGVMVFALIEQLGWEFEITPGRQIWFAGIGGFLAIVGAAVLIFPEVVQTVEDLAPTPAPTQLPAPFVRITEPDSTVDCSAGGTSCRFEIQGVAGGVLHPEDYLIHTFVFQVDPPGPGFFLQYPGARLNEDGTWTQFPTLVSNLSSPVQAGNVIRVQAALIEKSATYNDVPLNQLTPGFYLGAITDVTGVLAVSESDQLTITR